MIKKKLKMLLNLPLKILDLWRNYKNENFYQDDQELKEISDKINEENKMKELGLLREED